MSPCEVEVRPKGQKQWVKLGTIKPGDLPGSILDVSKGQRDVYVFDCAPDNSKSTIYRSRFGADWDAGKAARVAALLEGIDVVKEIKQGESHELEVTTERGHPGTYRFTHR